MASSCKYFDEDAVYKINKKGLVEFGLVLENSEFISSDEEDDDDPCLPEWERMKRGHVRVAWHPKGYEEVLPERKVKLFDRSLMPGDVVRKIVKGKDTQLGYCRNTDVMATVKLVGSRQVIPNVNSRDLTPLEEFSADIAVFLDSWVGVVKLVKSEVTVHCTDGSRCILSDDDALDLDDVLDLRDKISEFRKHNFYPGQQLWGPVHCFEKAKWLHQTNEMQNLLNKSNLSSGSAPRQSRIRVTVEEVKVVSLRVQWLCRAFCENSNNLAEIEHPNYMIEGDDLKRVKIMHVFEPCALQIGDMNFYVIKETDKIMPLEEWRKQVSAKLFPGGASSSTESKQSVKISEGEGQKQGDGEAADADADASAAKTVATEDDTPILADAEGDDSDFEDIDDDLSDGASVTSVSTTSSGKSSQGAKQKQKKGPSLAVKVLKKKKLKRAKPSRHRQPLQLNPGDLGVTETLVTETKADVVWQDGTVEKEILSSALYPIHHLDNHEFFPGDFVVENQDAVSFMSFRKCKGQIVKDNTRPHEYGVVKEVDHTGRTAIVTWMETYTAGENPEPKLVGEQEVSVYDIKDHPDFRYRPGSCVIRVAKFEDTDPAATAGQIIDCHPSGRVEVSWVNGNVSQCYPQELYRIGEYDSDGLWEDDSNSSLSSWETESEDSIFGECDASGTPGEKTGEEDKDGDDTKPGGDKGEATPTAPLSDKDDSKALREKLLANIEKLRVGMARLDEVFMQNPGVQSSDVMRKLLEIYKHCKLLDQLLGTTYFHEKHLQSLVDKLRQRGRVNSAQHVANQISRLFSSMDLNNKENNTATDDVPPPQTESSQCGRNESADISDDSGISSGMAELTPEPANKDDDASSSPSPLQTLPLPEGSSCVKIAATQGGASNYSAVIVNSEQRNVCHQLCAILKARLLKAHEAVVQRFGMCVNNITEAIDDDPASSTEASSTVQEEEEPPPHPPPPMQDGDAATVTTATTEDEKEAVEEKTADAAPVSSEAAAGNDKPEAEEEDIMTSAVRGVYSVLECVPDSHKYKLSILQPVDPKGFFRQVRKEVQLFNTSLPEGIIVKGFEDRMDLYSVLIKGPKRTPYEDGLFLFDFQLPSDYPKSPPLCHYISYCSDKLNPNLYECGKVCVSLLGTWGGYGTEVWTPQTSTLLQVVVSIQGLILVSEPYYNEAGYERQRGTQQGKENSRMYNEMVTLKLIQATSKMVTAPTEVFKDEIKEHFQQHAPRLIRRLECWLEVSEKYNAAHPMSPTTPTSFRELHGENDALLSSSKDSVYLPEFPLIPASKGFCLTLRKLLASFKEVLTKAGIPTTMAS